ncbi:MAG: hypothetical protein COX20_04250 [Desulfobacterales bacterium CG23_combo_of_CG06-09_8_20_14_all_52_9]|nr:MAG: hypothetical protein COX20_04250 [Desulfobacterales bacterium CG23_combo_of_CG06-09_8_20_14_all_52_9]
MVPKFFQSLLQAVDADEFRVADLLEPCGDLGAIQGNGSGRMGEYSNSVFLESFSAENNAETKHNQEGKDEIPTQGAAIPEKFQVSGIKYSPKTLESHFSFLN